MQHELSLKVNIIFMSLVLSGCVGTTVLRDIDESQEYPDLNSVPSRPKKPNVSALKKELANSLQSNKKMLELNKSIQSGAKVNVVPSR